MLPATTRSASRVSYTCQQAILAIKTRTSVQILPTFTSKKCSSVRYSYISFSGTFMYFCWFIV